MNAARDQPGDGIRDVKDGQGRESGENGVDPEDAEAAGTDEGDDHGEDFVADAAEDAAGGVHPAADEVREAHVQHADEAGFDRALIGGVDAEKLAAEDRRRDAEQEAEERCDGKGSPQDPVDPVKFPRAVVLGGKCRRRMPRRLGRGVDECADALCSGIACDDCDTERVDRGLNQDIGQGK